MSGFTNVLQRSVISIDEWESWLFEQIDHVDDQAAAALIYAEMTHMLDEFRQHGGVEQIDASRFSFLQRIKDDAAGRKVVLFPLYREIHTVGHLARQIRLMRSSEMVTVALLPSVSLVDADNFDYVIGEPFICLWPLLFNMLKPDVFHVNVGWGIQALPFIPFIKERGRVLLDFYEVLVFVNDSFFEKTHSTGQQVKDAAGYLFENYPNIMHFCSDNITKRLRKEYDIQTKNLFGVTEYLHQPIYAEGRQLDGKLRLVYGGCLPLSNSPDDLYLQSVLKMLSCFAKENLQLYLYNSPYLHGLGRQYTLEQLIEQYGYTGNVNICSPLCDDEYVRTISHYDYGMTFMRSKDMGSPEYTYFMAHKFLSYLQAGLPVIIDDNTEYMASLVKKYNIGIVLSDNDYERIPEILNAADYTTLKQNVIRYRKEFSIEIGARKVLSVYDRIVQRNYLEEQVAHFITVIAAAENRLYYRDQTVDSLMYLVDMVHSIKPDRIVELGTLSGLSLRTWQAAAPDTPITAIDLSFQPLLRSRQVLPLDLTQVTLLEQDILTIDFASLWKPDERVILYIDAHDDSGVPIMEHLLTSALPALPAGSMVIVDDIWYSPEMLDRRSAEQFFKEVVINEIDPLQCFDGYYASYWKRGSFFGFMEVIPLLEWVNSNNIELDFRSGVKSVGFLTGSV
jgi:predicted O-methyltransferase YrrM